MAKNGEEIVYPRLKFQTLIGRLVATLTNRQKFCIIKFQTLIGRLVAPPEVIEPGCEVRQFQTLIGRLVAYLQ